MKETKFKQVIQSLDSYRKGSRTKIVITDQQKEFLLKCRDNNNPVPYDVMCELWQQLGWGVLTRNGLYVRYTMCKKKQP